MCDAFWKTLQLGKVRALAFVGDQHTGVPPSAESLDRELERTFPCGGGDEGPSRVGCPPFDPVIEVPESEMNPARDIQPRHLVGRAPEGVLPEFEKHVAHCILSVPWKLKN